MKKLFAVFVMALVFFEVAVSGAEPAVVPERPASLQYRPARAYHIPPETTTEESGYFSLNEGLNGKIYIGTSAYGRNAYLVEFDPATEKMRIVLDVHKLAGLPLEPTGYAAQAKLHTRNFVGPSGTIYVGTKQGYPTKAEKKSGKIPVYHGGYVMTYQPATGEAKNLGMPMPLGDSRLQSDGASTVVEGEGVIDVVADEARELIYVITCEHEYWMLYDMKKPEQGYRLLGPVLNGQPNTLIDAKGRATAITHDWRIARYDPATDKVTVDDLILDGKPIVETLPAKPRVPDWRLADDGRSAYLQLLNDLRMFKIDLGGETGTPVPAWSLGNRIEGKGPDSRGSISIAGDGRVYSAVRINNETGFGKGYLHYLVRHDPKTGSMENLGLITVENPDFFDFEGPQAVNPDGTKRPRHGFHRLPDGTMTPLHVILALIVAKDGTIYATTIYPFTLLRIPSPK